MKKKSSSQSAFFNPRALIGLFVCLAGVLIAFFAFGVQPKVPASKGMTRQDLVGLYEALAPADFVPPACVPGQEIFNDVPASSPFCPWIEELVRRGITTGCAPGLYCPLASVTRQQMAVFLVKVVASEAFHEVGAGGEPPFENGWHNEDPVGETTAAFYKDPSGVVHLKGILVGGVPATDIFHLPPGYRVTKTACIATIQGNQVCFLSDGAVRHVGGSGAAISLDGTTFLAGSG